MTTDVHLSCTSVQYNLVLSTTFSLMLSLKSHTNELNGLIRDTKNLLSFNQMSTTHYLKSSLSTSILIKDLKKQLLFSWFTVLYQLIIWCFILFSSQRYTVMILKLTRGLLSSLQH